jgi:hypothetical protein
VRDVKDDVLSIQVHARGPSFRCNRIVFPAFPVEPVSLMSGAHEGLCQEGHGAHSAGPEGDGTGLDAASLVKGFAR